MNRAEIRRRYADGESSAQLGREYGVSYMTILRLIPKDQRRRRGMQSHDLERLRALVERDVPRKDIAAKLGCSVDSVYDRISRMRKNEQAKETDRNGADRSQTTVTDNHGTALARAGEGAESDPGA